MLGGRDGYSRGMISQTDFSAARDRALATLSQESGIGTLAEKLLHKTLKLYIEPRDELHEMECLGYVVDIKNESGIYEVQTANFAYLLPKLKKLLPESCVTVVYPIIVHKNIIWVDKETGSTSKPHKTTREGRATDVFYEASALSSLIPSPNLTLRIVMLAAEEYKALDGWDKTRKKGSTRLERIPTLIEDIIDLKTVEDYISIMPSLPERFTAKDFSRALRIKGRRASYSLNFLMRIGAVSRIGKEGRAYVYEITKE